MRPLLTVTLGLVLATPLAARDDAALRRRVAEMRTLIERQRSQIRRQDALLARLEAELEGTGRESYELVSPERAFHAKAPGITTEIERVAIAAPVPVAGEEVPEAWQRASELPSIEPPRAAPDPCPAIQRSQWFRPHGLRWQPYVEMSTTAGNARALGSTTLFVPLWQDCENLCYADVRGQMDDDGTYEGNWGLGYRNLWNNEVILGGYGFYDSRWTETNQFSQLTLGLEALAVDWEARVNGYLPDTNVKQVAGSPASASLVGNRIFVNSGGEVAQYGMDAEYGMLLGAWGCNDQVEWRGYAGGFWFDSDEAIPEIAGPRVRTELRVFDLPALGNQSRVVLGATYQWDQVRENQYMGTLQVRIPFGGRRASRLGRLERRMLERVVRDVDVVVGETTVSEPGFFDDGTPAVIDAIVDGNTADPAATVAAANGGAVLADGSNGVINSGTPIIVQQNQKLIGGGSTTTTVSGPSGASANLGGIGSRPTFNGTVATNDVIVVRDGATVRSINVTGGRSGISSRQTGVGAAAPALNRTGITIADNVVSGAAVGGYRFADIDRTSVFDGNRSTNNGSNGFNLAGAFAGTLTNNVSTGSTVHGFAFGSFSGTASNNTATNNNLDGFSVSGVVSGTFSNNLAQGNGGDGFDLAQLTGAMIANRAIGNTADGFEFDGADPQITGTFSDNLATNNGDRGYARNAGGLPTTGGGANVTNNSGVGNTNGNNTFP